MTARAWLLPILLAVPLAAAAYEPGSQVEADAPVTLEGRADTWLPSGTASYLGSGPGQFVLARLTAPQATLTFVTLSAACEGIPLPGGPSTCPPGQQAVQEETIELRDAEVSSFKALSEYKLVATTDRAFADTPDFGENGRLLVTTVPETAVALGTNGEAMHLSSSDADWKPDTQTDAQGIVYAAEQWSAQLTASTMAVVRATGGFETYFQGVEVVLEGYDANGKEISRTFDTRAPSDERGAIKYVVVEVDDGNLQATSVAPLRAFAPADQRPVTDVHARVNFASAVGTVQRTDKPDQELASEDASLAGPLSLTLTKIAGGSQPRLTFAIADGLQLAAIDDLPKDESIPPGALAAATALGAGGAGALMALAYFWPRLKLWATLLLLPMYTRIERDAVLQHEKRDELYELIRTTPGIHAHEIGEKANIGWGTTVYHLKLLENHGLIVSKKSGRYKRFFVNTGEYTKKKDIYGALRNETAKAVAQYIVDHPGTTQKEMCAALSIQPSLASWHVEKLEGVELVKRVKDGRMVRYFAGPAWQDLNVRVDPMRGGADTPVET